MTKIILLNGPAGSGKDTAFELLKKEFSSSIDYDFKMKKLAQPLKWVICQLFDLPLTDAEDKKDEARDVTYGFTLRELFIWMSEEVIKPKFGVDFFGKMLANQLKEEQLFPDSGDRETVYVITDCGFPEEAAPIVEAFGEENILLLELHREGTTFEGDSRRYVMSELSQKHDVANLIVENNGTLEEFKDSLNLIVSGWLEEK